MSRELVRSRKTKSYGFVCAGARKLEPAQMIEQEIATSLALTCNGSRLIAEPACQRPV